MVWRSWRRYFESNGARPHPTPEAPCSLSPEQQETLLRSLQSFQLGETSEGRLAHEIDQVSFRGTDEDFRACIKLFVREEGRHARLLGLMVKALGGSLLQRHWTASSFTWIRRAMGIRIKLLIALVAEVVGAVFYGMLAESLPAGTFAQALRHICDDERAHLAFQVDFFRTQLRSPLARAAFRPIWWALSCAAVAVVLFDHRRTLRAFGIPSAVAIRRFLRTIRDTGALESPQGRSSSAALRKPSRFRSSRAT
ncbi:MAG: ferritin-like domain-containing protein [Myxococcaceae bacterium]